MRCISGAWPHAPASPRSTAPAGCRCREWSPWSPLAPAPGSSWAKLADVDPVAATAAAEVELPRRLCALGQWPPALSVVLDMSMPRSRLPGGTDRSGADRICSGRSGPQGQPHRRVGSQSQPANCTAHWRPGNSSRRSFRIFDHVVARGDRADAVRRRGLARPSCCGPTRRRWRFSSARAPHWRPWSRRTSSSSAPRPALAIRSRPRPACQVDPVFHSGHVSSGQGDDAESSGDDGRAQRFTMPSDLTTRHSKRPRRRTTGDDSSRVRRRVAMLRAHAIALPGHTTTRSERRSRDHPRSRSRAEAGAGPAGPPEARQLFETLATEIGSRSDVRVSRPPHDRAAVVGPTSRGAGSRHGRGVRPVSEWRSSAPGGFRRPLRARRRECSRGPTGYRSSRPAADESEIDLARTVSVHRSGSTRSPSGPRPSTRARVATSRCPTRCLPRRRGRDRTAGAG